MNGTQRRLSKKTGANHKKSKEPSRNKKVDREPETQRTGKRKDKLWDMAKMTGHGMAARRS